VSVHTTTSSHPEAIHPPKVKLPSFNVFHGTAVDHVAHFHHWLALGGSAFGLVMVYATLKTLLVDRARRGGEGTTAGLNYVIGPMGSGKSMFGVRVIVAGLLRSQYAVTNVRLLDGWAERVVAKTWPRMKGDARARAVRNLQAHYVYEPQLRVAMRYRVPCAVCGGDVRACGHIGPEQECRAVFVWDETHNDLNNRDYQGHGDTREERDREKERRRLVIRWATQLRKLGFSGYLLSQHHENTDAQLRRVCNHLIRLQNQRNSEGVWLARLLPRRLTLFLVYWYPAHLATGQSEHMIQPIRRERYWLPWTRTLYDSWETFHGIDALDGEDSPILLPPNGRQHPEPPDDSSTAGGGSGVAGVPRQELASA
jgi:hypothetical protein